VLGVTCRDQVFGLDIWAWVTWQLPVQPLPV
jgi:hypothetical protein